MKEEYFDVLQGDDMIKWFDKKNYLKETMTLSESQPSDTEYDLLLENTDKVRLLVMYSSQYKYYIIGRALLWKLNTPKNAIFMDRIFFKSKSVEKSFEQLALKNKWYYKYYYDSKFIYNPLTKNLDIINLNVKLKPNLTKLKLYNLTVFNYYNPTNGMLSIKKNDNCEKIIKI